MRPYDPRLARYARATRAYLALTTGLGLATVALVIAQAALLATAISAVFLDGADLHRLRPVLVGLAAVVLARAGVTWAQEMAAHRVAAAVKTQLRTRLLAHVLRLGPGWLHGERAGEVTTLATRGLDALDAYFARYLPQLVLAALVPAAVLAWILPADLVATATILVTLPLIPLFMALVGRTTERLNQRQFAGLARLGHHLLELVAGLPTLKVFGRAKGQARAILELTERQRRLTMRTLRLAFLSSLVLELLATLSVALVAVGIGLRVVGGSLDLRTALLVLILAPEAYLPLRQLGAQYHASGEGLAAAQRVFDVLDTAPPVAGTTVASPGAAPVVLAGAGVRYPGRSAPALPPTDLRIEPGELLAVVGPSGSGKSTVVNLLLGFVAPTEGRVMLGTGPDATDLADVDLDRWRDGIAYVPQRPYLFAGTVAGNIALGADPAPGAVRRAADRAGLDDLPQGLSTVVEEGGAGLSAGQRQRVALARAFLRDRPLVLLDEPTANLDPDTEREIIDTIRRLALGRTVVVASHRPALVDACDRRVDLGARIEVGAHLDRAAVEVGTPAPRPVVAA
jgi:thiol reductant ABC exporter CydD subunit